MTKTKGSVLLAAEEKIELAGNKNGRQEQYAHDLFTEFALDFIESNKKKLFFLYLPYTVPHANYEIPSTDPYSDKTWPQLACSTPAGFCWSFLTLFPSFL